MIFVDAFFALRPLVLVPAWSFLLIGCAVFDVDAVPWMRLARLTAILLATHLCNQVVDRDTDRLNDKGFFLQRGIFTVRHYGAAALVFLAVGLGPAWMQRDAAELLTLAAALGLAYSLPPLRLSHRPVVDLLANALGYGGVAMLLAAPRLQSDFLQANLVQALQIVAGCAAVGCVFLHTTLLDRLGDAAVGKRTTGVVLGPHRTRVLAASLAWMSTLAAAAAVLVSLQTTSSVPAVAAALLIACLLLAVLAMRARSERLCVGATAAFALVAACFHWWFGAALLLLVAGTRFYYRRRFGLAYPDF